MKASMNDEPVVPAVLGRYKVVAVLGRGAMGVVYEAVDPYIERRVAIKTLDKSQGGHDAAARFLSEARAVGRLVHPNIVQVFDAAEDGNVAYMVMELVHGDSLLSRLRPGQPLDLALTVRTIGELLSALGFAHAQGVVHRDVKPSNVLIDDQGRVKLADFGVAFVDDSTHRTAAGTVIGTPSYMAPEQLRGEPIGAAADIFSVGVVLYQMLTGRVPFKGDSLVSVMYRITHEDPPAPSTLAPALPGALDRVVARALAKQPAQRYASAQEFAQALRDAVQPGFAADASGAPRPAAADRGVARMAQALHPGALFARWGAAWRRATSRTDRGADQRDAADVTVIRLPVPAPADGPAEPRPGEATVVATAAAAPVAASTPPTVPLADRTMLLPAGASALQQPTPRPSVQLVVTASADARMVGRVFPIDNERFELGRGADVDLAIPDHLCSRRHAVIEATGAGFVLRDVSSSNGTVLNGRLIDRGTAQPLLFGAAIRIGDTVLTFTHARDTTLPDLTGQLLAGRYLLRRRLRESPKATFYEAQITGFGASVAVKLLSADLAAYPGYREQFEQEARVATQMQHPHICQVLDHGVAELMVNGKAARTPYLCYELMNGGSLAGKIADKKSAPTDHISRWVSQMASALEHAHRKGIVHGDLKPTSVCFDADGNAYVTDFAIAGTSRDGGLLMGAPAFMAPELWQGETPSPKTDQFALAALAYSLVTGSRPFTGQEDPKTRERNFRRPPVPAHEEAHQNGREDIARAVSEVLQRGLASEATARFESVEQFAQAFDAALHRRIRSTSAPTVFVSYQHEASAGWAVLLARELRDKHRIAAFVDTQRLDGAVQFPAKLARAIENCEVFVCLLAQTTLGSRWVREEIRLAHEFKRPMIPVFQESFAPLERDALEPAVDALLHYDGVHLLDRRNIHIDHTIDDLARLVMDTVAMKPPP
jgi:serine/threonine protein kinase